MIGKFEGSIETDRPKVRGSGSLNVSFERAAEQKPHQQKFESIGNSLRPCKGGGYQNVELRDSGQPISWKRLECIDTDPSTGKDNECGTQRALFRVCEQSPCMRMSVYNDTILPMNKGSEYRNAWLCVDLHWLWN